MKKGGNTSVALGTIGIFDRGGLGYGWMPSVIRVEVKAGDEGYFDLCSDSEVRGNCKSGV